MTCPGVSASLTCRTPDSKRLNLTQPVCEGLLERWVTALGRSADVVEAGRDLLRRYTEPHRRYHDTQHLRELLAALDLLTVGQELPLTVLCAAFWHDAIYEPVAADNERCSADLAGQVLSTLGLGAPLVDEVVRLVLLTAEHDPRPDDEPGALLCDADLAVLAAAPDRYRTYAQGVREEYAHLSDEDFRRGRSAVLGGLLHRPQLFSTLDSRRRWEHAARRNVQGELDRLGEPE